MKKNKIALFLSVLLISATSLSNVNAQEKVEVMKYNSKDILLKESIIISKDSKDIVTDFFMEGSLINNSNSDYAHYNNYGFTNTSFEQKEGNNNDIIFNINSHSFQGNELKYQMELNATAYNVDYVIDDIDSLSTNSNYTNEVSKYLLPSENIESDNYKIEKVAEKIIGNEDNPYKKAKAIFDFVYLYMDYDLEQGNNSALTALDTKIGVCEDYSRLMVALLRSVGVPSRTISGYRLPNDVSEVNMTYDNQYNHMWVEFYLEEYGWIPVDPTITFVGEKFIVDSNFANLNQYYLPISIDGPIYKKYNYLTTEVSTPNLSVSVETYAYVFDSQDKTPLYETAINNFVCFYYCDDEDDNFQQVIKDTNFSTVDEVFE